MSPLIIPNTTTQDDYAPETTFAGHDIFSSGYFTIANASVALQLSAGIYGQGGVVAELFLPPGTYPFRAGDRQPIGGLAFRSFAIGAPAQIFGALFYPGEATIEASSPFDAQVDAAGSVVFGGAGMQLIETIELAVSQASVPFVIPQTFKHLEIIASCRGDTATTSTPMRMQFNGDTAGNYDTEFQNASAGVVAAALEAAAVSIRCGRLPANTAPASAFSAHETLIPNYRSASHKGSTSRSVSREGAATTVIEYNGGNWRNVAAITGISLFPLAGNFIAGSRFDLYGIA